MYISAGFTKSLIKMMLKKSGFYLDKQKSFVPKQIRDMLVIISLECKISDFLNSNTCFCLQLCSTWNIYLWYRLLGREIARYETSICDVISDFIIF